MRCLALAALTVLLPLARADIHLGALQIAHVDDGFVLDGQVRIELNQRLEDTLNKAGLTLYFAADFQLTSPRWYWFDEDILVRRQVFRLSYNTFTLQYRLQIGQNGLSQSFSSLEAALRYLSNLSRWGLGGRKNLLRPDLTYEASLRIYLDKSQLPRPFQMSAIANSDWRFDTGLYRWQFTPGFDWLR